jgi:peptide-methionine (R)-S-oxide reductase
MFPKILPKVAQCRPSAKNYSHFKNQNPGVRRYIVKHEFMKHLLIFFASVGISSTSCAQNPNTGAENSNKVYPIAKTDEEWKSLLSPQAYNVLREQGTERAFTGEYNSNKESGSYLCAGCNTPLFTSKTKFDSGTGWPSFYDVINPKNVQSIPDHSHGWVRTEVVCGMCGGHLGHVFDDGPKPTGLRYCINSVSLDFVPAEK